MGYAELIHQRLQTLPSEKQAEVYDFVEFIVARARLAPSKDEHAIDWTDADFSHLAMEKAMRGLEDDPVSYALADLKERWK